MATTKEKRKHIGFKISKARRQQGMSLKDLAAKLKATELYVSNIENSEVVEDADLIRLAEAIGVTPEYILNLEPDNEQWTIGHQEIHAQKAVGQITGGNQINYPLDEVIALMERLIRDKDELIREKDALIEKLRRNQDIDD